MKILIAEDDATQLKLMKRLLTIMEPELEIDTVYDGLELLHMVETNQYDVILTDINMPCCNGMTAINIINGLGAKHIRTIAITGMGNEEPCMDEAQHVFTIVMQKPIKMVELLKYMKVD